MMPDRIRFSRVCIWRKQLFLQGKVVSLVSDSQPGGPRSCIYVLQ
jgi:hypothetical protein